MRSGTLSLLLLVSFVLCLPPDARSASPGTMEDRVIGTVPLFSSPFMGGRLVLASGGNPLTLYLLSKRMGTLFRLDPLSGRAVAVLSKLGNPQDMAVGKEGKRILVDLDSSRLLLVALLDRAGPPAAVTLGLNPGQILRGPDGDYYLTARAVHILYKLDPDRYAPLDWVAVGDVFRRVMPDTSGILWLPLYRSGTVLQISPSPFRQIRSFSIPGCDHPIRVLPLRSRGFLAGCRDAIVRVGTSGGVRRLDLPDPSRHDLRDMILLPDGRTLLLALRRDRHLLLADARTLVKISSIRLPSYPVRLYNFSRWPELFVVMNDPDHDQSWVSAYPLTPASPVPGSQPGVHHGSPTLLPRKTM